MPQDETRELVPLDVERGVWSRVFTVSPLVVVGTKEGEAYGLFLRDGHLFLECELDRIIDGFGDAELITGRIVAAHAHRDALRVTERDDQRLIHDSPLLAYIDPGRFAAIRESDPFPFPAGFLR